jgi:uncharacterized protein YbaP (TraB family)
MRKTRLTINLLIIVCSSLTSQAQSWPSSLLWRISGNGLQQPSYLYGTMHLSDRRLFYFSDSLYKALEQSQGFAMELDPEEMMDSVLKMIEKDESPLLKDIISEREYKKISQKLEKEIGIPADKITRKKISQLRRSKMYAHKKDDAMKTAMDLYLYDIAKRMGKTVGGIEDVSDQMDMLDETGKDIKMDELLKEIDDENINKYMERMISLYVKEDINGIDKMIGSYQSNVLDLVKRNKKMAVRMDSLANIRNSFFAVGAAHLPGDSGVITMLRSRGFTVEPVISANKIAPEKYAVPERKVQWQKITGTDSAYTIEMPGKASDLKMFEDELKFKTYIDMSGGNKVYMSCVVFIPEGDSVATNEKMKRTFSADGFEGVKEKKILHMGMEGKEVTSLREKLYYRMQFFPTRDKLYMLFNASPKKEELYGEEPEHFFQSFKPNILAEAKAKNWSDYTDTTKGFTVAFPGKMTRTNITPKEEDTHTETISLTAMDIRSSTYFMLVVSETTQGYYITDDSLIFNQQIDNYNAKGFEIEDKRLLEVSGFPAVSFVATGESDGVKLASKMLIISRGNRNYTLAAITEKGKEDYPDVSRFFRSFNLMPYKPTGRWSVQPSPQKDFTAWMPSVIDTIAYDTTDNTLPQADEKSYVAFDKSTADNYYVSKEPLPKYFYTENDSSFLAQQIGRYYTDTASYLATSNPGNFDSLVSKKNVTNGKVQGIEILTKNTSKSHYKRLRLLRNGDIEYSIFMLAPYATLYNENTNRFFDDFRFMDENKPTTLFTNKTTQLLADLQSADSAIKAGAKAAFTDRQFEKKELPVLYDAFLKEYSSDSSDYYSVAERITEKIERLDSVSTIAFVKDNYAAISVKDERKMQLLRLLAGLHKQEAVSLLKTLILTKPYPTTYPGRMIYELEDSLPLAKQLFPEAEILFEDSMLGPAFISVAIDLADSGFISKQVFTNNKNAVMIMARHQLASITNPGDQFFVWGRDVIKALEYIADADAVKMLNKLMLVKDLETKKDAMLSLVKLGKPLPPAEVSKLLTDPYYRLEWYRLLKDAGKKAMYPKEFLTQKKFAEGYINMMAGEEDIDTENMRFTFLAEKTALFKGMMSRFYMYKLVVKYEDEKYEYAAVAGPFEMDKTKAEVRKDEDWTRIFYDEEIPLPSATDKLFQLYLKDIPQTADKKN